jgi:uncharacterized protein YhhL (DUF1145 family)
MYLVLKIACLAAYGLALAGLAGLLSSEFASRMQNVAAVLLILHALEVVFMFKHVRKYQGPLMVSVLLTLLFGLLHWKPLVKEPARKQV